MVVMENGVENPPICPFCALPVEPWQESAEVNGEKMHFDCYREKSGY